VFSKDALPVTDGAGAFRVCAKALAITRECSINLPASASAAICTSRRWRVKTDRLNLE